MHRSTVNDRGSDRLDAHGRREGMLDVSSGPRPVVGLGGCLVTLSLAQWRNGLIFLGRYQRGKEGHEGESCDFDHL